MTTSRALLVTDAVDSTRLTQALGDAAMAQHWAVHDRAARDLLPLWRGREIDKTDGMLLLFDSAADAAGCALAYHRALATLDLPFKARAGIHVGEVTLRANPPDDVARGAKPIEVDGLALPVTARVMSIALGGQTLLTAEARIELGVTSLRLQSHGHWRLQGVSEPVELFEVGDADAPFTPPPDQAKAYRVVRQGELWQPVRQVRHSAPAERDSFVDRHEPLLELARKFESGARLVSVLGMGGTGKTRLVTRYAWTWLGEFAGGVWFCDLSQARSVDGICSAVALGMDVPLGKSDPVVQLANAINGHGACLIILDNFEQVTRHAEETLGRWLDRAAQAKFIVTTREALGVPGEHTLALAPLPVPHAVTLFEHRAAAATGGALAATAQDREALAPLVALLDGLPLAIELAAARVSVMTPRNLLNRMTERFKLLASHGGRHERQATLRATLDWSWDLLAEPEKAALAQLSVFEGGFTIQAVEAVLDLSSFEGNAWPVDALQSLVDKSLVRRTVTHRFDLFQSVHEYAAEHLRTEGRFLGSGPTALTAAQQRHGVYFGALGHRHAGDNGYAELDNLIVACRRAALRRDGEIAASALVGAWERLKLRGPYRVAIDLAAQVGAVPAMSDAASTLLQQTTGRILVTAGRGAEARVHLEAALATATRLGDRRAELQTAGSLAEVDVYDGRMADAARRYEQALAGARDLADRTAECGFLNGLGMCREFLGDLDAAALFFEAGLTVARASGDRRWEGGSLGNLGQLHANRGRAEQARRYYDEALHIACELGDQQWEGNVRCNLGLLHFTEGHMVDAREHLNAALVASREMGHARLEAIVLCNLGIVLEALAQPIEACATYEQALQLARELHDRRSEGQFLGYLGLLHARQRRFDHAQTCLETGEALLTALADRMSLGVLLCGRAEAAQLAGDIARSRAMLDRATQLHSEVGTDAESEFGTALARVAELIGRSGPWLEPPPHSQ